MEGFNAADKARMNPIAVPADLRRNRACHFLFAWRRDLFAISSLSRATIQPSSRTLSMMPSPICTPD